MRRAHTALLVTATALVVPMTACSGAGEDAGDQDLGEPVAAAAPDPCDLLDAAAIERVTGWAVSDGQPADQAPGGTTGGMALCHFREEDHVGFVQVAVADEPGSAPAEAARRELAAEHDAVVDVTVDGAEGAFEARALGVIGMVVDGRFVEVAAMGAGLDEADHLELADLVVERM